MTTGFKFIPADTVEGWAKLTTQVLAGAHTYLKESIYKDAYVVEAGLIEDGRFILRVGIHGFKAGAEITPDELRREDLTALSYQIANTLVTALHATY